MDQLLDNIHNCLLNMLKDFHKICMENNLTYYLIGGTFLGAVRHKGFIPWDDDIDIGMPRESYERFLQIPDSALPSYLARLNGESKKVDYLYTKLCNKTTTLIENVNERRIEGIYIDVFPIDGASNTALRCNIQYYIAKFYNIAIWLNASDRNRKNFTKQIAQKFFKSFDNSTIYKHANKMLKKVKYENSRFVANFTGSAGKREIMKREYFGKPTLYKFEDSLFFGPEQAHQYLETLYGDYMKLPPPEKQKSHHQYEYINLEIGYEEYLKQTGDKNNT